MDSDMKVSRHIHVVHGSYVDTSIASTSFSATGLSSIKYVTETLCVPGETPVDVRAVLDAPPPRRRMKATPLNLMMLKTGLKSSGLY